MGLSVRVGYDAAALEATTALQAQRRSGGKSDQHPFWKFVAGLENVSPGNLRALYLPQRGNTETTISTPGSRVWTHSASIAARITDQGHGILVSFNGTDQYVSTPDTTDLSFGNGTADSPFSMVVLANITATITDKALLGKNAGGGSQEWLFEVIDTEQVRLRVFLSDGSHAAARSSDVAITAGVNTLIGASYSAATGGATAGNDMVIYKNGAAVASTATNDALYTAMSNTGATVGVGAQSGGGGGLLTGSAAFAAIYAANLSPAQHAETKRVVNEYYGLSL